MQKKTNVAISPELKAKIKANHTWQKLIVYCKRYLPALLFGIIVAVGSTVFTILAPDKVSELTNEIQKALTGEMNLEAIKNLAILLAVFYVSCGVLSFIGDFIMAIVAQRISKQMRGDISKKINKLPLNYYDTHTVGDTLSRVSNDVDTIGQTLNQQLGNLIACTAVVVGSLVMMFVTNWIMALVAVGSTIVGFSILSVVLKRSQKYFTMQQQYLGGLNGHIEEAFSGQNIVKVYNAKNKMADKFNGLNSSLYSCAWKSQFLSGLMMPIMGFIGNLGYVAVCVVGAVLVMNGTIEIGVIVAFIIYVRLFSRPLSQIAQALASLQQTSASSFRVFEFLGEKELADESCITNELKDVKGDIAIKNVNFAYTSGKEIIKDLSVDIKAGQKVAIVGPTGAGKTTIVNLLMKFYDTTSGTITIDGVSIEKLKRENVHNLFCMVLQDTWLFEGTIMENLKYNDTSIPDEKVVEVCKFVGVDYFIKTLPDGYNTMLGDEASVSVGQKQLLTIARAMLQDAPMLILDEATSSVDTRTEQLLQNAMDKLMQDKTSIIIAHRLSTIKNADMIIVLDNGKIVECGNHEKLMSNGGMYAELYNSQFED